MRFSVGDIMELDPCEGYDRAAVELLWAGRARLSAREIAKLTIPALDRIWALSRFLYIFLPYRVNRVTRMIALDVVDHWACPDIVWWYLITGNDFARAVVWAAAWHAVWDATRAAARAAARVAARAADWTADWDVAWYAARDAAWAADWDAASAAAWDAASAATRDAALTRYLDWIVDAFGEDEEYDCLPHL